MCMSDKEETFWKYVKVVCVRVGGFFAHVASLHYPNKHKMMTFNGLNIFSLYNNVEEMTET